MSVKTNKKFYVLYFGFDMFKQVQQDIFLDSNKGDNSTTQTKTGIRTLNQLFDSVSMTASSPVHIKSLQDKHIKQCIITWSKIILKTDNGDVFTSGSITDKSTLDKAEHITSCGEDIIMSDKYGNLLIIRDTETSCVQNLLSDDRLKDIINMDGTEQKLHVLTGDGSLLCVNVTNSKTKPERVDIENVSLGVPVTQISCGKEHVLMLDCNGSVYSFGGGSRGQLGHGTLEDRDIPTNIGKLLGVKMMKVAAGGWHSICISDDGDVYVWGWNESGQLGLPCQNCKTNISFIEAKVQTEKHQKYFLPKSGSAGKSNLYNDSKISDSESGERLSQQCVFTKTEEKSLHETDQSDDKCHHQSDVCIEHGKNQDHMNDLNSKILRQDIEAVQIQSIPCVLDLVDDIIIKDVSCGSRHSAFVTEDGILLTCGWNHYGQLGHGDEITRPYLQTVDYLLKHGYFVDSVNCGSWSTIVTCSSNVSDADKFT